MKMYNNGQRPQKMYGGGMMMPRKPMMVGGLAQKNRTQSSATPKTQDAMGMNLGGAIKKFEKKSNGGKTGAKPDFLDFDKDGNTTESMRQALAQKGKSKKKKPS